MKRLLFLYFSVLTVTAIAQTTDAYLPDTTEAKKISGMSLVFNDEFNTVGKPNPANWGYESGFVRNMELQWYQSENANCSAGRLQIVGRKSYFPNPNYVAGSSDWKKNRATVNYTSACILSRGKKSWLFGRFEIRARIDTSNGSWPAIWTLGNNLDWPSCGEIDMMEFYRSGGKPIILANFAWGTSTPWVAKWDSYSKSLSDLLLKDSEWPKKYHVWRMDWTKDSIRLYVDDILLNYTLLNQTLNADGSNPFLQPHYLLLNLAIGSNGGDPSKSVFPINYEVDYVRVYQKTVTALAKNAKMDTDSQLIYSIKNKIVTIKNLNPTSNQTFTAYIYDTRGVMVLKQTCNNLSNLNFLDLSDLMSGLYWIKFSGLNSGIIKVIL